MDIPDVSAPATATGGVQRKVGPYVLLKLLGKSAVAMVWLAHQVRQGDEEVLLYLPRHPLGTGSALTQWQQTMHRLMRIQHPRWARILSIGVDGLWPYVVVERGACRTLAERIPSASNSAWPAVDAVIQWTIHAAEALALLHEAGVVHADIGQQTLLIDADGAAYLMPPVVHQSAQATGVVDQDLIMVGLLLHGLLLRRPALDRADLTQAAQHIGQEIIRLPWTTPQPVAEPLRAIINRATDQHPGRRFVSARGLLRALSGWQEADGSSGAIAQLLNHLPHAGLIPASPELKHRMAHLLSADTSLDAMVEVVLEEPALTFELLRMANAAGVHGIDEGAVLSPRRALQLLGTNGLRRAASALKPWPGTVGADRGKHLHDAIKQLRWVACTAAALSPPGLRREEPAVAALFQGLGRLLPLYHFPEEAQQIQALIDGGMPPVPASCAVLGTDEESLALAVLQHWGWRGAATAWVQPFNAERTNSRIEHIDWLKSMATAAHEAIREYQRHEQPTTAGEGAQDTAPHRQKTGISAIAQKYHRVLGVTAQELKDAVIKGQQKATPDKRIKSHSPLDTDGGALSAEKSRI